jgi:hypothetical protein
MHILQYSGVKINMHSTAITSIELYEMLVHLIPFSKNVNVCVINRVT